MNFFTIEMITNICKSIKVTPKSIFIDSAGSLLVEFELKKHSDRFNKAMAKYFSDLNIPRDENDDPNKVEDWEINLINEKFARRH